MAAKIGKDVAEMLAGADGVTVFQEKGMFGVAFGYGDTLLNKMHKVPEATFDKEGGAWMVPEAKATLLVTAVQDMRDFNRSGGVQVKDVEGGKVVLFDFSKAVNQVIGPVAEFSQKHGAWYVAADSKALVAEEGKISPFEYAVNQARGMVIEVGKGRDQIMDLAAGTAKARDYNPGIHFPAKEQSYTGPILNANGHFAAQLTGVDDKTKTMFIVVHKQADLGRDVLKGDDLRIDYGTGHDVRVRTSEVFREQQTQREALTKLANDRMDGAVVRNASFKDGQEYSGNVVQATQHFVLQHNGRGQFTLHDRARLDDGPVVEGENMSVKYKGGQGFVSEKTKGRELAGAER